MKRVAQHIIEEESRKAFANILPNEWVANDFNKDYGKDIHVEIFSNHTSTGNIFIVQLKGSAQKIKNDALTIQIKIDVLVYYQSLNNPVLLVFYSTINKSFFGIWANALLSSLDIKEEQEMVSIQMDSRHRIDSSFFNNLEESFTTDLPSKMNLIIKADTSLENSFKKRIIKWLDRYYANSYKLNDFHLPLSFYIEIRESENVIDLNLEINQDKFDLQSISKDSDLSFLLSPITTNETMAREEAELLLILSSSFSRFSPTNSLHLLKRILPLYDGEFKNEITLLEIGNFAIDYGCKFELQQLIDITIENELTDDFQYLNNAFFRHQSSLKNYRENLIKAIEKFRNDRPKASLCYNLANHYRHQHAFSLSANYFNIARKLNPQYLTRHYWWHEYAGVLFLSQHEKIAEDFYRKSIELDTKRKHLPLTHALLGDCLLWQGRFQEAKVSYDTFLREVVELGKLPPGRIAFMHEMCKEFIEMELDKSNFDKKLSSALYWEAEKTQDEDIYNQSITAYPLNYYAWSGLGYLCEKKQEYLKAFYAIKNSALIQETDKTTWLHCLIMSLKAGLEQYSTAIFTITLNIFGEEILDDFNKLLHENPEISFEQKEQIINEYTEFAQHIYQNILLDTYMPEKATVRVLEIEE